MARAFSRARVDRAVSPVPHVGGVQESSSIYTLEFPMYSTYVLLTWHDFTYSSSNTCTALGPGTAGDSLEVFGTPAKPARGSSGGPRGQPSLLVWGLGGTIWPLGGPFWPFPFSPGPFLSEIVECTQRRPYTRCFAYKFGPCRKKMKTIA